MRETNGKYIRRVITSLLLFAMFIVPLQASKLQYDWSKEVAVENSTYVPSIEDIYADNALTPYYGDFEEPEGYTDSEYGDTFYWQNLSHDELLDVEVNFNHILQSPEGEYVNMKWEIEELMFFSDDHSSNLMMGIHDNYLDIRTSGIEFMLYSTTFTNDQGEEIPLDGSLYTSDIDYGQYHGSVGSTDFYITEDSWLEAAKFKLPSQTEVIAFTYEDLAENFDEEATLVSIFRNKSKMYNIWGMSGYDIEDSSDDWSSIYNAETFFFDMTFIFTNQTDITKTTDFEGRINIGDTASYKINVRNDTLESAYEVSVRDNIAEDTSGNYTISNIEITNNGVEHSGKLENGTLVFDQLRPGEEIEITYDVTLNGLSEGQRFIDNYANDTGSHIDLCIPDDKDCSMARIPVITSTITPEVNQKPEIVYNQNQTSILEEDYLDDSELIDYLELTASETIKDVVYDVEDIELEHDIDYSTPGTYDIIVTATGSTGNDHQITIPFTIVDILPSISNERDEFFYITGQGTVTDSDIISWYGLNATEITENDLTPQIVIDDSDVDYDNEGIYTITAYVYDEEQNTTQTLNLSLQVINRNVEPIGPSINIRPTISGRNAAVDEHTTVTDEDLVDLLGITVVDGFNGKTTDYKVEHSIDTTTPGNYEVVVSFTNENQVSVTKEFTFTINDLLPSLTSQRQEYFHIAGNEHPDLTELYGIVASELEVGDLTNQIEIDDTEVEYDVAGEYTIYVSVTDDEQNSAQPLELTLIVYDRDGNEDIPGVSPIPEISSNPGVVTEGTVLHRSDLIDTLNIEVSNDHHRSQTFFINHHIDWNTPGDYDVTITAVNKNGAHATKVETLTVADEKPTITSNLESVTVALGDTTSIIDLFNITAHATGDYSQPQITLSSEDLDLDVVDQNGFYQTGTFYIDASAYDDEQNLAELKDLELIVTTDRDANPDLIESTVDQVNPGSVDSDVDLITPDVSQKPQINGNDITILEETEYSQSELLEMMDVVVTEGNQEITNFEVTGYDNINFSSPGEYELEISYTNARLVTITETFSITIEDIKPELTAGVEEVTFPIIDQDRDLTIDDLTSYNLTATEINEGDLTNNIYIKTDESILNEQGSYQVTVAVSDEEGNTDDLDLVLNIVEGNDPTIDYKPTIIALPTSDYEGVSYTNEELKEKLNVVVIDGLHGITKDYSISHKINFNKPGTYHVLISYNNGKKRNVKVVDYTVKDVLPTINAETLTHTMKLGDHVVIKRAFGLSASEISDGDLTRYIEIDDSNVDYHKTGTYPIYAVASDNEGNTTETLKLTLNIERNMITDPDTKDPQVDTVITVVGDDIAGAEGTELSEELLIELMNINVTDSIKDYDFTISHNIDWNTPGNYDVTVNSDVADTTTFTYTVNDVMPSITSEVNTLTIKLGDQLDIISDYGIIAETVGDIDDPVLSIDDSNVDYNQTGSYSIIVTATDEEGNDTSVTVTLVIERDITDPDPVDPEVDPIISIVGNDSLGEEGTVLTDQELANSLNLEVTDFVNSYDYTMTHNIDWNTPSDYDVVVTSGDYSETFIYTITDVLPSITVNQYVNTITLGDSVDVINDYGLVANTIGDNLDPVVEYDDSKVDYTNTGVYPITVYTYDEEGNKADATIYLVITSDENPIEEPVIITGSDNSGEEGTILTDAELGELLNITATKGTDKVDYTIKHSIDWNTPNSYPVTVTSGEQSVAFTYTVTDIKPTIESLVHNSIYLGDSIDILSSYEVSSNAIGDSVSSPEVIYNDSLVNYQKTGTYPIILTTVDEEGNTVRKLVALTIKRDTNIDPDTPDVAVDPVVTITGVDSSGDEGTILTDEELAEELNIKVNDTIKNYNYSISHNIDWLTPGNYPVTISTLEKDSAVSKEFTYSVNDVLPTLGHDKHKHEINHGNRINIEEAFGIYYEVIGDNIDPELVIDDSQVLYHTPGNYPITISVTDEENNTVSSIVHLSILADSDSDVDSETDSEVDSETDSEVDSEVDSNDEDLTSSNTSEPEEEESSKEQLANSGSKLGHIVTILLILLVLKFTYKLKLN